MCLANHTKKEVLFSPWKEENQEKLWFEVWIFIWAGEVVQHMKSILFTFPFSLRSFPGEVSLSLHCDQNWYNFFLLSFITPEEELYLEGIYSYRGYWQFSPVGKKVWKEKLNYIGIEGTPFCSVLWGKKKQPDKLSFPPHVCDARK